MKVVKENVKLLQGRSPKHDPSLLSTVGYVFLECTKEYKLLK